MFRLIKRFRFEASHMLPFHDGKCAHLHGHSYTLEVICEGDHLETEGPKQGMLVDYGTIGDVVGPLVKDLLDHKHLNSALQIESPTSELIAERVYRMLKPQLPSLAAIAIEETESSRCEYRP